MEPTRQESKSTDEIDLTQFFRWVGRGFSRFGTSILFGLASLRNLFFSNRLFFAGIIVLGLLFGGLYSQLLKKEYYKTSMVLSCDYLNTQILRNTIEKLNLLCEEEQRKGLMAELKLDSVTATNVQKFEFATFVSEDDVVEMEVLRAQLNNVAANQKDVIEKVISKLTITNKNAYMISAYVYDPRIVKSLETAIVNYFRESDYIKNRIEISRTNLLARKEKLVQESGKLDSLKVVLYQNFQTMAKQPSRGSNNVILGDERLVNPLDVYTRDMDINKELLEVDKQLYLKSDFELVDGFTTFQQPESASLFKILVISFFISWVMGYLIIGAWKFDRLLASYDTKKE